MPNDSIPILHEDRHLLFVNKPPRMLAVPADLASARAKGRSLTEHLAHGGRDVLPVHRLDYDTSGVMVFAKDAPTRDGLIALFRRGAVTKVYLALVQGWPRPATGVLAFPIRDLGAAAAVSAAGEPARTRYATLRRIGPCALLSVEIDTGRHNQIRLHFAHIGHPLVGERKYAIGKAARATHNRVLLHAFKLGFQPPHLSHVLCITAPPPADFDAVTERLQREVVAAPPPRQPPPGRAHARRRQPRRRRR
ncbi:MAG: RluA family pseudouridine synthase [Planctomycetota bacterium]